MPIHTRGAVPSTVVFPQGLSHLSSLCQREKKIRFRRILVKTIIDACVDHSRCDIMRQGSNIAVCLQNKYAHIRRAYIPDFMAVRTEWQLYDIV